MKITEKLLLDNYYCLTMGMDNISKVNESDIYWNYRFNHAEGYCVTDKREKADCICLEYNRDAIIELDASCTNHSALQVIAQDIAEITGDEI